MLVFVVHCSPAKLNENLPISFSSVEEAKDMISTINKYFFVSLFVVCEIFSGDAFCDFPFCMYVCVCVCVCVCGVFFGRECPSGVFI